MNDGDGGGGVLVNPTQSVLSQPELISLSLGKAESVQPSRPGDSHYPTPRPVPEHAPPVQYGVERAEGEEFEGRVMEAKNAFFFFFFLLTELNPLEHFTPLKLHRALNLNPSVYRSDRQNANCTKGRRRKTIKRMKSPHSRCTLLHSPA